MHTVTVMEVVCLSYWHSSSSGSSSSRSGAYVVVVGVLDHGKPKLLEERTAASTFGGREVVVCSPVGDRNTLLMNGAASGGVSPWVMSACVAVRGTGERPGAGADLATVAFLVLGPGPIGCATACSRRAAPVSPP